MLKVQEIREIIKLIDESSIDEFTYETNGTTIMMKKSNSTHVHNVKVHDNASEEQVEELTNSVSAAPVGSSEKAQTNQPAEQAEESLVDGIDSHEVISPMVGTFYRSSSPERDPYVKTGSKIDGDTVVCIVEAMKLFNEIEAEVSGEIIEILAEDGELVEYGQPLFRVKTK